MIAVPPGRGAEEDAADGSDEDAPVETRTVGDTPGAPIPRSFAGFSMEYWSAQSYVGGKRPNPIFAQLVQTLAAGGNGAPTIRIGGNSTDESWWNPVAAPRPAGVATDVTPQWLGVLGQWAGSTRTPIILGVNLASGDSANAAAYAQAAAQTLPPGTLSALEIGNEPDLYTRPREFAVGSRRIVRGLRRPAAYGPADYRSELQTFRAALAAAAPGVPMAGGGFATSAWEDGEDDLLSEPGPGPMGFSAHTYALHTCDRRRARTALSYARSLLGSSAFAPPVARMAQLAAVASAHGATFRVSETNSANCGGVRGASNSVASALWGVDMLFALANAGVRNVNFHTFNGALYAPVDFGVRRGHFAAEVHPLFYGMLLFARANPHGARLLPTGPEPADRQAEDVGDDRSGRHATRRRHQQGHAPDRHGRPARPGRRGPRARRAPGRAVGDLDAQRDPGRPRLRRRHLRRQAARQAPERASRTALRRVPAEHAAGHRGAGDDRGRRLVAPLGRRVEPSVM